MLAWVASAVKIVLMVGWRGQQRGKGVAVAVGRVLAGLTAQDGNGSRDG
jgi:hypothetical protein